MTARGVQKDQGAVILGGGVTLIQVNPSLLVSSWIWLLVHHFQVKLDHTQVRHCCIDETDCTSPFLQTFSAGGCHIARPNSLFCPFKIRSSCWPRRYGPRDPRKAANKHLWRECGCHNPDAKLKCEFLIFKPTPCIAFASECEKSPGMRCPLSTLILIIYHNPHIDPSYWQFWSLIGVRSFEFWSW